MKIINQSIANRGRGVVSGNILRMVTVVSDVIVLQLSVILYIWKLVTQVVCDKEQIYYVCCSRLGLSNTAHSYMQRKGILLTCGTDLHDHIISLRASGSLSL